MTRRTSQLADALGHQLEREEMLRAMARKPGDFLKARLCLDGVPWVRFDVRVDPYRDELDVSFLVWRKEFRAPVGAAGHLETKVREFGDKKWVCHVGVQADRFGRRSEPEAAFDLMFDMVCHDARRFLGDGAWAFAEVLTNEQAWARLKSLRGDFQKPGEPDPWRDLSKSEQEP